MATIRFEDERGEITRASLAAALDQTMTHLLVAKGDAIVALKDGVRMLGEVCDRFLGRFERLMIADEICLKAALAAGDAEAGERIAEILYVEWSYEGAYHYNWNYGLRRQGKRWVPQSTEAWRREDRLRPVRKLLQTQVSEVQALAKACDPDARDTLKFLSEEWTATAAHIDRRISRLGREEAARLMSASLPTAFTVDTDEAAP